MSDPILHRGVFHHERGETCTFCGTPWPCLTAEVAALREENARQAHSMSVMQDDLLALLRALGMGDHARPQSPHEVMLEAIAEAGRLVRDVRELHAQLCEIRCLLYEDGWDAVGKPEDRLRLRLKHLRELVGENATLRRERDAEAPGNQCQRCGKVGGRSLSFPYPPGVGTLGMWICPYCVQEDRGAALRLQKVADLVTRYRKGPVAGGLTAVGTLDEILRIAGERS